MQKAAAAIQTWHSNGARIWQTPIDALITTLHQTIATAKRLLDDLTKPSSQSMPRAKKQKFLHNFRNILDMHARSQLEVAGLKAIAVSVKWEFEEMGEETEEEAAKWEKLSSMLTKKEEVMNARRLKISKMNLRGSSGVMLFRSRRKMEALSSRKDSLGIKRLLRTSKLACC